MEQAVLEVKDLKFKYRDAKRRVLNGLNFQVKKGEFLCIIGQNGSGKSTLCNALVGLIPYYFTGKLKGQIFVDGVDTQESSIAELSSKILLTSFPTQPEAWQRNWPTGWAIRGYQGRIC